jgi:hypothetical protein
VSKLCHEPRAALAVLLEMLAPHITSATGEAAPAVSTRRAWETIGDTVTAVVVSPRAGGPSRSVPLFRGRD